MTDAIIERLREAYRERLLIEAPVAGLKGDTAQARKMAVWIAQKDVDRFIRAFVAADLDVVDQSKQDDVEENPFDA